jgi:hypothetical protein
MTLFKASRLPVLAGMLCLLLMGFAGTSYGVVRFDTVPSPTEVINWGVSEVTGSITLIVRGSGNQTGTSLGGHNQIGIIYNSQGTWMPIDNTTTSGIRLFWSAGFDSAAPVILSITNETINGKCSGFITIDLTPGALPTEGDFIRIDGVRGRINASTGVTQGTDLYASMQSINDPSAANFTPDAVRVAKSLPGMAVKVTKDNQLLCFPTTGVPPAGTALPGYSIRVTEGFARAFVDLDANNDGSNTYDRVDSGGNLIGAPTNSTQVTFFLDSIPASVSGVNWPATSTTTGFSQLTYVTSFFDGAGNASAIYNYDTINQTDMSDTTIESFAVSPILVLKAGATQTGTVNAAAALGPTGGNQSCQAPSGLYPPNARPRFLLVPESDADMSNEPPGDPSAPYSSIIRCNCYMLFTYVTSTTAYNTGIAVANTSQDSPVFGTFSSAPNQIGKVTFYFYSVTQGYRGFYTTGDITFGQSYVGLVSQMLGSANMPDTEFTGYIIAKAEFQFCHAISYIADVNFAAVAQGYSAMIIPDPAIKNVSGFGRRVAADAGDLTNLPAGEGLNN